MSRLTITLSDTRYRALKEAAAQRDKTIGQLIDESLEFYGIKSRQDARDLVRRSRAHSKLSDEQALTAREASTVARILEVMLTATFAFVVSEALLAEYRALLVRPNLRKLHGLTVAEVGAILTDLAQRAIVLAPVAAPPAPDSGDQLLWDLLAARTDLLLVTGDKLLLQDAGLQGRVVSAHAFVAGS
jgi:uncharacterized protein